MINIKICGLTTLADAQQCCESGAWALGFNFYPKSPRCVSEAVAKKIIETLPQAPLKIGIYIDESYDVLARQMDNLGLDLIQVYAPVKKAPRSFKERLILSLQAATTNDLPKASILSTYGYILLDAPSHPDGLLGGTGRRANWTLAKALAKEYPLILAGGLEATIIKDAVQATNPYALDFASGVERSPGIKHQSKLNQLFKESRYVN